MTLMRVRRSRMSKIIFENGVECEITSAKKSNNLIKIFGTNIPQNTSGFVLIRDFNPKPLDYTDYTTVNRAESDGITFSNDESVYEESHTIQIVWNDSDDYDGIRPISVDVNVKKNGLDFETITLNSQYDWKRTYTDEVNIPTYDADGEGIQGYEKNVSGLTITYSHSADIPTPPTPPTDLESRVEELENDMRNLNYVIGGEVG